MQVIKRIVVKDNKDEIRIKLPASMKSTGKFEVIIFPIDNTPSASDDIFDWNPEEENIEVLTADTISEWKHKEEDLIWK